MIGDTIIAFLALESGEYGQRRFDSDYTEHEERMK
jgi:hypothetical protein